MNFQFKIGFLDRYPLAVYDPVKNKFTGSFARFYNKQIQRYSSINYTVVLLDKDTIEGCDSVNCTGLIGQIQKGEIDLGERPYSFATIADSIDGLKPGPVLGDVSCNIVSALPKIGTVHEDVLKSLSIFTSDAIICLTLLFLLLFSILFILWYFKSTFCVTQSHSQPAVWSLSLCQGSWLKTLLHHQSFQYIWMSIILTQFFIITLYSGSFKTDLTTKGQTKTIDSLSDVANCDRTPLWMEEPLCRIIINSASPLVRQEILKRGRFNTLGDFVAEVARKREIERYVLIITAEEIDSVQLSYCLFNKDSPAPQWYQSTGSFPVYLSFSVLSSKLSPDITKIIDLLHEKQFESRISTYIQKKWRFYVNKLLDPDQKADCLHETSISVIPMSYLFNKLDLQNYKHFFKYFALMITIGIIGLTGEYLYFWISTSSTINNIKH